MLLLPAFAVLLVCALLGALRAYQIGEPLRRMRRGEAFAEVVERHRSRLTYLVLFLAVIPVVSLPFFNEILPFTPEKQAAFTLFFFVDGLLISLAVAVGDYPTRRAILNDERSLFSYISFTARLVFAFAGFWMILLFAPMTLHQVGAGIAGWIAAGSLAALLLLWSRNSHRVFSGLLEARPLEDEELLERFEKILENSTASRPEIYECGPWNGGWCNAAALPSTDTPRIVLSHPLLELLDKEESAAIFAHEVAHLEDFNASAVRVMRRWETLLILASCFLVPVLLGINPSLGPWGYWGWLPVAIGLVVWRIKDMQHRETASDLRAVDLSENPKAMISALVKLHEAGRLPRRVPAEVERSSSHPSLARRIREIREHVRRTQLGLPADVDEEEYAAAAEDFAVPGFDEVGDEWILAFTCRERPGEIMVIDEYHVTWLSFSKGKRPAISDCRRWTADEFAWMRHEAVSERAVAFEALTELRLVVKKDGAVVRTVESSGGMAPRVTEFPIVDEAVHEAREILDRVDTRLAPVTGPGGFSCGVLRLVCFSAATLALLASLQGVLTGGVVLWLLLVSLPALSLVQRPWVAALGAMAIWASLSRFFLTVEKSWWTFPAWAALVLGTLAGAYCIYCAFAKAKKAGKFRLPAGAPATTAMILVGMASFFALLQLYGFEEGQLFTRLYAFGLNSTGSFLPLVGAAAALITGKWISARVFACLLGLIGVSHVWIGSQHFLENFSGDPLVAAVKPFESNAVEGREINGIELDGAHRGLVISPRGTRFLTEPDAAQIESSVVRRFRVMDWEGNAAEFPALKVHFVDEDRLLVLVPSAEGKIEIQTRHADHPEKPLWRQLLPGLDPSADLALAGEDNKWRVTANPGDGTTLRLGGIIDTEIFEVHTWSHHTPGDHWRYIGAGERCLQVIWGGAKQGEPASLERLAWIFQRYWHRNELQWLTDAGAEPPGHSVLLVDACEPAFGQANLMLFLYGPTRGWVCAANTVNGKINPIAAVEPKFRSDWNGEHLALLHRDHLLLADPKTREAVKFNLPRKADWNSEISLGETAVAVSWVEGDRTRVSFLEIPADQKIAARP